MPETQNEIINDLSFDVTDGIPDIHVDGWRAFEKVQDLDWSDI